MSTSSFKRAIGLAGGPTALANKLGVTRQNVANWSRRGVPADRCIDIENAVGGRVTRHELRPDVFGPESADVAHPSAADATPAVPVSEAA